MKKEIRFVFRFSRSIFILILISIFCILISCSNDESGDLLSPPNVKIENLTGKLSASQGDTILLKARLTSSNESDFRWIINGKETNTPDSVLRFTSFKTGKYEIVLSCTNKDGESNEKIQISVIDRSFEHGTFILNEGNMTTENGSLIYISPEGVIIDSAYWRVNGTELGNVCQDLFITPDKKMYIISQNGLKNPVGTEFVNDGMLVVADALTLKKETAYNEELAALSWPTHIAVLNDENVFIRDNAGVYVFNTLKKDLQFVSGTSGAKKNTMAVANKKVFVACGEKILVLEAGKTVVSHTIDMRANISGVIKSVDNNFWVSTTGSPNRITKMNSHDYSVIKENEIHSGSVSTDNVMGATPGICAVKNTLYFSGLTTKIYRHNFDTGETEFIVDAASKVTDANIVYNTIAVHPITGEVYMNTLRGFGWAFLKNSINIFNFGDGEPRLTKQYNNYTHFPAGIFFTYNFE